jgi:hypothetical protein
VAGLVNGRVEGEGRAVGWWIGGAAGRGRSADVGRLRELWQRAPRSKAGTMVGALDRVKSRKLHRLGVGRQKIF